MKAMLVLEDGSSFEGISIGVPGERLGEVVLNTAVVGYQEMMTDPSNAGKILVLTYPLIGNYGTAKKFYESKKCWINALIIKEKSRIYSNWQAEGSFGDFLLKEGVVAISDVDTRTLTVTIRDKGEMFAIVAAGDDINKEELLKKIKNHKNRIKNDFIKEISVKKATEIKGPNAGPKIGVLDLGVPNSIIKQLKTLGCNITLLPYDTSAKDILEMKFDELIISSGPEDDEAMPSLAETTKILLGKIPILGIAAGHEIIGLALGAKLKKMSVGHHGVNYPAKAPDSCKGEITVQNHSFIIDESSIKNKKGVKITLHNINDNSIEEMESKPLKFISAQYCPASPGFDEVNEVFRRFFKMSEVQYAKT